MLTAPGAESFKIQALKAIAGRNTHTHIHSAKWVPGVNGSFMANALRSLWAAAAASANIFQLQWLGQKSNLCQATSHSHTPTTHTRSTHTHYFFGFILFFVAYFRAQHSKLPLEEYVALCT